MKRFFKKEYKRWYRVTKDIFNKEFLEKMECTAI
jgi:hypothetical protein